jgi:serine/threonine protein phosphatase PrpC
MTRSLGDLVAASVGVSSQPEITEHLLTSEDRFLLVATDGIW